MKKYCILGTDSRSLKLRELYLESENFVAEYDESDYIIAPIPFSKDGNNITGEKLTVDDIIKMSKNKVIFSGSISKDIKEKLGVNKIKYYDLLELEEVAILNSIPTAEGAIQTAMEITDFTLCSSKVLVMGFGRIGKVLSKMLHGIGATVYVEARKEKDIAEIISMGYIPINLKEIDKYLGVFNVIFNTIPEVILNKEKLDIINKKCCIIDLSSSPRRSKF